MDRQRRCIFCHSAFPRNDAIEHLPVGRRLAYDPGRGRLWVVCGACGRWNLTPFEERWEALEELERARRDRGRVLASTDTIALIRIPGLDVVRVGSAPLAEEAWWRYGVQMIRRRKRYRILNWAETAIWLGSSLAGGGLVYVFGSGNTLNNLGRWYRFGSVAWRGEMRCPTCGHVLERLTFRHARHVHLATGKTGDPILRLRCPRCQMVRGSAEMRIEGVEAEHLLRRVVTYNHYSGASEGRVRSAAAYIDRLGSPAAVAAEVAATGIRLDRLLARERRTQAVALEIALNEENERRLLGMELAELEARWREEEEIAAIVDGELTEVAGLERLRRALRGGAGLARRAPSPPGQDGSD